MAEMRWTPEQESAINARGGAVIVAAAAGSGKTAVLTERIVRMLVRENDPVEPEELLVVTFTRAAAAEMRQRISKKLAEYVAVNRHRTDLTEVRSRLHDADICTIDSFCIKLVRENYRDAGVRSDFGMLDASELKVLESLALDAALNDVSENDPEAYRMLTSLDASFGDEPLQKKVSELYRQAQARPWPEKWLRGVAAMYSERSGTPVWQDEIRTYIRHCAEHCRQMIAYALKIISSGAELYATYCDNLNSDIYIIDNIIAACDSDWDDLYDAVVTASFSRLKTSRKFSDDPAKQAMKALRDAATDMIRKKCASYMTATSEEHEEDMAAMSPVTAALCELSLKYGARLRSLMDERGRYDFTTILHLALTVLSDDDGGRSETAARIGAQYREILIDEYQDTNAAQDILFRLLSRDETNLFCVGDVKQSIYRFRMAMPEIFLEKLNTYSPFDGQTFPAKIILGRNFRSRAGVLELANSLFTKLMSNYAGEMEYTSDDMLYFGGGYDADRFPAGEVHLLQSDSEKEERSAEEARYVAGLITKMIADKVPVSDNGSERPCRPGDFCVLFRYDAGKGETWSGIFRSYGLECAYERTESLFDTPEIQIVLALLKVINNPSDDIAMLAVLTSPLYGFSPDDLALLKINSPDKTLYGALTDAVERGDEKAAGVINGLAALRHLNSVNTLDTFMRALVHDTDLITLVSSGEDPQTRQSNVIAITELAAGFAENGGELSGFIRYIDSAIREDAAIPAASDAAPESDVVRLMTIHRSKGLEFPFVIISDTQHKFNVRDLSDSMIINPDTGIGLKRTEQEQLKKYPTIAYSASALAQRRAMLSEELRVLYVGITRARERIIITGSVPDIGKFVEKTGLAGDVPDPVSVIGASSQLDLIFMGLGGVPYRLLPDKHDFEPVTFTSDSPSIKFSASQGIMTDDLPVSASVIPERDDGLLKIISEKAGFIYPYVYPDGARPKAKASEFESEKFTEAYFAASKPGFMTPGGLSAAEIGTANHEFLERCDLSAVDARTERDRLLAAGLISARHAGALRLGELDGFLNSDIAGRIRRSQRVIREKEFRAQLPLRLFFPDAEDNVKDETILIIGKADLVFIEDDQAVILDYKTDRHKSDDDFRIAYGGQLRAYAAAMEQALGLPVRRTVIFALDGAREITIEREDA